MKHCSREGCTNIHLAKGLCNAHYRQARRRAANPEGRTGRPPKWSPEDLESAHALLEDGASYRETARSTPVPRTTLREKFPDMGWTSQESGQFGMFIIRGEHTFDMYKQIGHLRNEI